MTHFKRASIEGLFRNDFTKPFGMTNEIPEKMSKYGRFKV